MSHDVVFLELYESVILCYVVFRYIILHPAFGCTISCTAVAQIATRTPGIRVAFGIFGTGRSCMDFKPSIHARIATLLQGQIEGRTSNKKKGRQQKREILVGKLAWV